MGKETFVQKFNKKKSWGSLSIQDAKDLPTLKLRYLMQLLQKKKNASLLELGCGSGRILTSIRERDNNIELTGIDISEEQILLAKKTNKKNNINFVQGDAEKLPFKNSSFDYIIIMDFLEHIPHPQRSLNEVYRVLKKGGYLYAVVPAEKQGVYGLSTMIFRRHFKEQTGGHIQQFGIKELERMTTKAKLAITDEKFSYHLLGSLMDYALFTLMLNKKVYDIYWTKNKYYATKKKTKQSPISWIFNTALTLGNAIAYYESTLLKNTRVFATAVHITARKK